jgi:hypothetical protein
MVMAGQMFGKLQEEMDGRCERRYQILNWRNWGVKTEDRDEWRSRIKKARIRFGL